MVRITGDDWKEKLTPIKEVKKIPKGIEKLMNLCQEWAKGNGKTYGKTGTKIRNQIKKYSSLIEFITHLDISDTERVARVVFPLKTGKTAFFLKWTHFDKEIKTLELLRKTDLTGKVFGYINGPRNVPDFIIREYVSGADHRAIDLSKIPKGKLIPVARSLGKKLRKLHELDLGIATDGDIIFDLIDGTVYFVDFDRVRRINRDSDRIPDIVAVREILSTARVTVRDPLWNIFIKNYGAEFIRRFSSSRLKTVSKKQ